MSSSEVKLEQVYVHSRDLACRYVVVKSGQTILYSVKPQRNSIFFGIYKQSATIGPGEPPVVQERLSKVLSNPGTNTAMTFSERMHQAQLQPLVESAKLIGGRVHRGSLEIQEAGTYALVFDNTFSKQKSKLISYTLHVYASASEQPDVSTEALIDDEEAAPQVQEEQLKGILLKRRRKKLQGWARRWFVLDFESNTLNYYMNSSSTVLRGAISLKVAVFSANKDSLEINIDNGEIWNMRARSEGAFSMWCQALAASRDSVTNVRKALAVDSTTMSATSARVLASQGNEPPRDISHVRLWARLDHVLTELKEVKASVREAILASPNVNNDVIEDRSHQSSPSKPKVVDTSRNESNTLAVPKKNFWGKKRPSELAAMASTTEELFKNVRASTVSRSNLSKIEIQMESALQDFESILREHQLSLNARPFDHLKGDRTEGSRPSMESSRSEDDIWADAVSVFEDSGFLVAHHDPESVIEDVDDASSTDESFSDRMSFNNTTLTAQADTSSDQFNKRLYPLTGISPDTVSRRRQVPEILDQPPSTLKLMTSKVGSDVSSMSAPAASNEPLGLLQRAAEDLEYSELLDAAVRASAQDGSRILTVAAFAVSSFSSMRHKERAKRKPFNPMLGETYELVREDKGYRFIAEKVQHRPITGVATCAESSSWSFHQYQATTQKFYGKSMLLTTEGLTSVHLETGDIYAWEKPELYLKGITWGERFVEPSGEMAIRNLINGDVAIVKFLPTKGWGSGRSEEVMIEAYSTTNVRYAQTVTGNWTQRLQMDHTTVWQAGSLVDNPANRCGFTTFAAQLNEVTDIERAKLPHSDSRLRPDVRAREEGRLEEAEQYKTRVEEGQRKRRTEMESAGQSFEPRFFKCSQTGKRWEVKRGEDNYWALREQSFEGAGILDLFSADSTA